MPKSNALYVAIAPLALLLIAGVGAHFLPILLGDNKAEAEDTPAVPYHASRHALRPMPAPAPTPVPNVPARMQSAIEKTVSGQIAALHKNDFQAALKFSSQQFREMVTPDVFRDTLSRSYPQLLNVTKQTFEPAHGNKAEVVIPVSVSSSDGSVMRYIYTLESEAGNWRIRGCSPLGPPMRMSTPALRPGPVAAAGEQTSLR